MSPVAATADDVRAGLEHVRAAPADEGIVELISLRPAVGERQVLDEAELDVDGGLVGDSWSLRGRNPNRRAQVTVMNARTAALIAGEREHWPPAGDQLYVDL